MKKIALIACLLGTTSASARQLTLGEAVDLAFRTDPVLGAARVGRERSKLTVLRSQLDRVTLRVDGQIQELWNKSNIGGPASSQPGCTLPGGINATIDEDNCVAFGGTPFVVPLGTISPEAGQGTFNLTARLDVPIFSGLRVESNVKRAQRLEDVSQASLEQARRDIALAVARAYWNVRRFQLIEEAQRAALERMREAEGVAAARLKAGLAPPIDRNRAVLRRLQQTATRADIAGQIREATAQLAVALGIGDEEVSLVDKPWVPEGTLPSAADLVAEAQRGRAETRVARLQLEVQKQNIRIAASGFYPQLTGFGLFQAGNNFFSPISGARGGSGSTNPFSNLALNVTFGLALSQNFFDTLNTWTTHRDARWEESRLREEQRRVGRVVESDVRIARARVNRLMDRRTPLAEARDVARDNLTILEARYKNGDALVLEYLDGQVDLANAEQTLADVTAQLALAWIELEAALGRVPGAGR
jgi:outer membrane protein TolC